MEFKKYHKIGQFKDVVRTIQSRADYKGRDENGEAIYEVSPKPTLTFEGTVKLHGSNAGISYTPADGVQALKRSSLIGKEGLTAHFGFNSFVQVTNKDYFLKFMSDLWDNLGCIPGEQLTIYGEWAGEGVQRGVGVSFLEKSFFVFGAKITIQGSEEERWVDTSKLIFTADNVYNIFEFPTYKITIDFNRPELSTPLLTTLTENVEKDCPVSRQLLGNDFEKNLVGEGIVWTCFWNEEKYVFKTKGEKHSTTKVKTLASSDPEILNSIYEFVDYACTENRVRQGIQEVEATDRKDTPNLLRWVANDIISEEAEELKVNNLEWKQVAKEVSNRVRDIFFKDLDNEMGTIRL